MEFNFESPEWAVGAIVAASVVGFIGSTFAESDDTSAEDETIEQVIVTGSESNGRFKIMRRRLPS